MTPPLSGATREDTATLSVHAQNPHFETPQGEFAQAGYPVMELDGGWKEWQRHDLAIEGEVGTGAKARDRA
jgi:3-mercaptopyruvate sulfurtransferase SseA